MVAALQELRVGGNTSQEFKWELGGDDTEGAPLNLPDMPDKTITVSGTFNSQTCTIQYSNDGTVWFTATRVVLGTSLAFTANGGGTILENANYIKPVIGSGTGVTLNVIVVCSGMGR